MFPIFQLAHEVTFQVLRAHSTKRVAQRNKIPRQKKAATAGSTTHRMLGSDQSMRPSCVRIASQVCSR
ncbi:hypothetical protein PC113_g14216 [Phytophthora cactorum]|uniref:Uncharacterized protein n=1 Tax=Phytophthora cactorum TaxID=29920 RepID=A0A8T0YVF6_9STRA|nr:hypothetical protein PC113_g14216 [Phytophthora cactorum]KAG2927779.1 hypothetical protein PC117_g14502 [Phytophthora cactorum]KAG3164441.1 hypothetical protein PC128_g20132 [Phytophthora cactorum]